jgi:P27 family predicted phage terminase small subunit
MPVGRRPGRRPKPTERKRRAGNPGKRRLPEPAQLVPATDRPPKAPAGLQAPGKALWRGVWAEGSGWLAPTDAPLVRLLADNADEREALRSVVEDEGHFFTTPKGYKALHPAVGQLRAVESQMISILSLLGFTPTDRARLGLAEVKTMTSLADLMQRRRRELGR